MLFVYMLVLLGLVLPSSLHLPLFIPLGNYLVKEMNHATYLHLLKSTKQNCFPFFAMMPDHVFSMNFLLIVIQGLAFHI